MQANQIAAQIMALRQPNQGRQDNQAPDNSAQLLALGQQWLDANPIPDYRDAIHNHRARWEAWQTARQAIDAGDAGALADAVAAFNEAP